MMDTTTVVAYLLIAIPLCTIAALCIWIRCLMGRADKPDNNSVAERAPTFDMIPTNADLLVGFSCYICLDDLPHTGAVIRLRCGHHYHRRCVERWLGTRVAKDCPSCWAAVKRRRSSDGDHVVLHMDCDEPRVVPRAVTAAA